MDNKDQGRPERPTVALRTEEITNPDMDPERNVAPSIELVSALLERVTASGPFLLRLGMIEACHRLLDEMAQADARRIVFERLEKLVALMGRLPWD